MKPIDRSINPFLQVDPSSQEFAPSQKDIQLAEELETRIAQFRADYLTHRIGVYEDRRFPDPEVAFYVLEEIESDMKRLVGTIDSTELGRQLDELKNETVEAYVKYLHDRIDVYGANAAYIAFHPSTRGRQEERLEYEVQNIDEIFSQARWTTAHRFKNDMEHRIPLLADLDREETHFRQYQREPRLHAFEKSLGEILKYVYEKWISETVATLSKKRRMPGSPTKTTIHDDLQHMEGLITDMQDAEIQEECQRQFDAVAQDIQRIEKQAENEETLERLEARVQDMVGFPDMFEDADRYDIAATLTELRQQALTRSQRDKLDQIIIQFRLHGRVRFSDDKQTTPHEPQPFSLEKAFVTLGIRSTADREEIRKAWRRLALATHPDRNKGDDTAFKNVNAAYQLLQSKGRV